MIFFMIESISKTTFLQYLQCPKNTWLKLHKPETHTGFPMSDFEQHLAEQGNEVESCARNLFPGGIEVVSTGEHACHETVRLMATQTSAIFQATFIVDGFIARNDVLKWNEVTGVWDLYEVKATNSLKEGGGERDHIKDVAFQVSVLKRAHVPLGRYFVIHLNKEYVRYGELDINALFSFEDVTDKVTEIFPETEVQMSIAREYLHKEKEPEGGCDCVYVGRKRHCTTFQYSHPHVPDYSVHDIARITEKKLTLLVEQGIFSLDDIPEDFDLSDKQKEQISVHGRKKPQIDKEKIKEELYGLRYPLYFFDYEAYGPAIPTFDGFGPYKHIPFQFSLHIVHDEHTEPTHVEFLHEELTDPSEDIAVLLEKHILPGGTVIAWHKSYESMINREIAIRLPHHTALFERINAELYDLEDIFKAQHYIHDGFHGSSSIKKVLPVIAPHLSYAELDIHEGGQAADSWWTMVSPATSRAEKAKISSDLKRYCGLDTYAMYAIWWHLRDVVREG